MDRTLTFAAACLLLVAAAARPRDGAVIVNSGSTNFAGSTVQLWSDGKASAGRGVVPQDLAARFFTDVGRARSAPVSKQAGCMKSASFGSTTTVTYHGWTSPDLECPMEGHLAALQADVHQVIAALQIGHGRRVPLMPEPRRLPIQASPSPEPGSPAS